MKLAILTGSLSRLAGGTFTSIMRPTQLLASEYGNDVGIFGISDCYSADDLPSWQPLKPRAFDSVGPRAFGYSLDYCKAVETFSPDIIQVHGIWMYFSQVSLGLVKKRGTPCIISPHGMLDPWAVRNSYWKKRLAGLVYENEHLRRATCLRALCEAEARAIRDYGLKNPIALIPNGIDLPEEKIDCPPPWQGTIENGKKILLFLSRIHEKKGLPNLLHGWARARQSLPASASGWDLAIAGWDTTGHQDVLEKLRGDLNLRDSVHFIGPQFDNEKAAAYRHASAFVLPSYSEGLPMTILEAWAYELPVLMTPECNLPEGFSDGAALQVDTNAESIADGLLRLFEMSDEERISMGLRGQRLVKEKYTWGQVAAQFNALHDYIAGANSPPDFMRLKS